MGPGLQLAGVSAGLTSRTEIANWERTGLPAAGFPTPEGAPATFAHAAAALIEVLSGQLTDPVRIDGPPLLGERVSILQLPPAGRRSSGGTAQLVAAVDGWFALNLPRPDDVELIPALVSDCAPQDAWSAVCDWAANQTLTEVEERTRLLGLAAGALHVPRAVSDVWRVERINPSPTTLASPRRGGLVVNMGSLWAAPLCAQVLRRVGYQVVDIESPTRPDGSRVGAPAFYARLHAGHERAVFSLRSRTGRQQLADLVALADVVITGSRPAALERLGLVPGSNTVHDQVWTTITGHFTAPERIAFGDDAAVAGGLVAWANDGTPLFAGDAIADPLTGLAAAVGTLASLAAGGSWRVSVALSSVASYAARLGRMRPDDEQASRSPG
jgi:hypothetical protein